MNKEEISTKTGQVPLELEAFTITYFQLDKKVTEESN